MSEMERWDNFFRDVLFYVVPLAGGIFIWRYIDIQFLPIGDPASVDNFRAGLIIMVLIAWICAFLWWRTANIHIRELAAWRRHLERYSFIDSLIPVAVVFLAAFVLYMRNPFIVHSDLTRRYRLNCIFVIPFLFSGMMYFRPPRQISRVIMPGPLPVTMFLRVVATVSMFGFAFWYFGVNFLW